MSKTQQKSKSEVEHLRGENKRLRSENRQLRKEVNALRKRSHFYENIIDEVVEEAEITETCDNCGKGTMMFYDLVHVKVEICNLCGFKRNLNNGKKDNKKTE